MIPLADVQANIFGAVARLVPNEVDLRDSTAGPARPTNIRNWAMRAESALRHEADLDVL